MVIYHNRAERFDAIINNVNTYLKSYFHDLRQTIDGLQPLVDQPCENIDSGLPPTPRSAPTSALSCWSKTASPLLIGYGSHEYAPQPADPGHRYQQTRCYGDFTSTPMMPKSAALALWVGKPGDQNSGIALAIDHTAISTFSNRLVDPQTLHNAPIRRTSRAYR